MVESKSRQNFNLDWDKHIARNGRLCVFVGSGISMGCTTKSGRSAPSWEGLIDILAKSYGCSSQISPANLDLLEKAEIVDRERVRLGESRADLNRRITSIVDIIEGEPVERSAVHETLRDINPELIITTNYDRIIERFLNGSTEPGYNVWTYPGRIEQISAASVCSLDDSLGDLVRSGEPVILKIHGGSYSDPSQEADAHNVDPGRVAAEASSNLPSVTSTPDEMQEVVLSFSSYRTAYSTESELPPLLRTIFASYQVIFIGYSLRDQVLRDIMQSVGALRGKRFRHIVLQSPDSVVPKAYQEAFEDHYGVVVGTYSDHSLLAAGLHGVQLARG